MTPQLPELDYENWRATRDTLHRWLQIIGKVQTTLNPWTNHAWHTTLLVSARGLITPLIATEPAPFTLELDLIGHRVRLATSAGDLREFALRNESVASFFERFRRLTEGLGIDLCFVPRPDEVPDPIPFALDTTHCTYDPASAARFAQALVWTQGVLQEFRSRFLGKCSPVHFFWGSMDLAVTRFSGRRAPDHPGGVPGLTDDIVREAYSHEVSSCGFWPGDIRLPEPAFYAYAYPQPDGFDRAAVPQGAYFHPVMREFILPYSLVRANDNPEQLLLSFCQATYEAAADLAKWDRPLLEESPHLVRMKDKQARQFMRCHPGFAA